MSELMEKRKYERVSKCIPMKCVNNIPGSEESSELPSILTNMSCGGIYFICKDQPNFEINQTITFTIDISTDFTLSEKPINCYFNGQGKVIRIDSPKDRNPGFGVAVEFLTPLGKSPEPKSKSSWWRRLVGRLILN